MINKDQKILSNRQLVQVKTEQQQNYLMINQESQNKANKPMITSSKDLIIKESSNQQQVNLKKKLQTIDIDKVFLKSEIKMKYAQSSEKQKISSKIQKQSSINNQQQSIPDSQVISIHQQNISKKLTKKSEDNVIHQKITMNHDSKTEINNKNIKKQVLQRNQFNLRNYKVKNRQKQEKIIQNQKEKQKIQKKQTSKQSILYSQNSNKTPNKLQQKLKLLENQIKKIENRQDQYEKKGQQKKMQQQQQKHFSNPENQQSNQKQKNHKYEIFSKNINVIIQNKSSVIFSSQQKKNIQKAQINQKTRFDINQIQLEKEQKNQQNKQFKQKLPIVQNGTDHKNHNQKLNSSLFNENLSDQFINQIRPVQNSHQQKINSISTMPRGIQFSLKSDKQSENNQSELQKIPYRNYYLQKTKKSKEFHQKTIFYNNKISHLIPKIIEDKIIPNELDQKNDVIFSYSNNHLIKQKFVPQQPNNKKNNSGVINKFIYYKYNQQQNFKSLDNQQVIKKKKSSQIKYLERRKQRENQQLQKKKEESLILKNEFRKYQKKSKSVVPKSYMQMNNEVLYQQKLLEKQLQLEKQKQILKQRQEKLQKQQLRELKIIQGKQKIRQFQLSMQRRLQKQKKEIEIQRQLLKIKEQNINNYLEKQKYKLLLSQLENKNKSQTYQNHIFINKRHQSESRQRLRPTQNQQKYRLNNKTNQLVNQYRIKNHRSYEPSIINHLKGLQRQNLKKKEQNQPYINKPINSQQRIKKLNIPSYQSLVDNNHYIETYLSNVNQSDIQYSLIKKTKDLDKFFTIFPQLPQNNNPYIKSEQLTQLAKKTFNIFKIIVKQQQQILILKRFKNCLYFNYGKTHILWHFSGKFYIGGWIVVNQEHQGYKSGKGIEVSPKKYIYEGEFIKGKRCGFGVICQYNGDYYIGNWLQSNREGKGKLVEATGIIYEGEWKMGKKHGYGKLIYSKTQYYEGKFNHGQKHGVGKQFFRNGDSYQGQYHQGVFSGQGIYRWSNGAIYSGQFRDGKRNGKGKWKSVESGTGDSYDGEYKQDKKQGYGRYTWQSKLIYQGYFLNDLKHGQGKMKYENGKIIRGIWLYDKLKKKIDNSSRQDKNHQNLDDQIQFSSKDEKQLNNSGNPLQKRSINIRYSKN